MSGLETFRTECRRAVRALWRNPLFSGLVLALLTVTIGAATAIGAGALELLNASLPYGSPDRLVMVWSDLPKSGYLRAPLSCPEVFDLRQRSRTLADVAALTSGTITLEDPRNPAQISVASVTQNFFEVMRASPALGATFAHRTGTHQQIILSWNLWQRRFGGDPAIVGRQILYAGDQAEIVGVMPASFRMAFPPDTSVPPEIDLWSLLPWSEMKGQRHQYNLRVIARVRDGATIAQAGQEVSAIGASLEREFAGYGASGRRLFIVSLIEDLAAPVRVPAQALLFVGLFLVLLAYVNVAGLWIATTVSQRHEHALHQALGASIARVRGQLLIRVVMLSAAGALLGLAAGWFGLMVFRRIRPVSLLRVDYAGITFPLILDVLGLVALLTVFAALASQASIAALSDAGPFRTRVASTMRHGFRAALVTVQIALVLVFLICSALWTRSFLNVLNTDLGYQPAQVVTFKYAQPPTVRGEVQRNLFNRGMDEALRGLPGVVAVGTISHVPFDLRTNRSMSYQAEGAPGGNEREADARIVSPGFLNAIGGRVVAGRFFEETDDPQASPAVVVDRLLAERTWPGEQAVGKRLNVQRFGAGPPTLMTVIGVVEHLRHRSIEMQVREQIYISVRQMVGGPYAYMVRSNARDLAPLMAALPARVAQVEPRSPVWDVRTLQSYYDEAAGERRFTALMLAGFALASLLLSSIGVYGLLTYIVASRRSEFGVRIALGATRRQVTGAVMWEGLRWAMAGLVVGALLLYPASAQLSGALYGIEPHDPLTWGMTGALLIVVVAIACGAPALRAGRTDPSLLMKSQ